MKRNLKKGMTLIVAIVMAFSSMSVAFAVEQPISASKNGNTVTPYWVGLNTITNDFQISSGGFANIIIRGTIYSGEVDYVNVRVSLKRGNGTGWTTIQSWNQNIPISLNKFTFNKSYGVSRNYYYKYSATVKSYKNSALVDSVSFDSKILTY